MLKETLNRFEAEIIRTCIRRHHGVLPAAAKDLAISTSWLYARIHKYGLEGDMEKARAAAR